MYKLIAVRQPDKIVVDTKEFDIKEASSNSNRILFFFY